MVSNKHEVKISLHDRIIATAIIGRIILLSIKFIFLLILKQFVLTWINRDQLILAEIKKDQLVLTWINKKPVKSDNFPRWTLSLFGLGIMHVLCLLVFPRQTKAMLQK